eukprot:3343033-Rhodomonas_salina.2
MSAILLRVSCYIMSAITLRYHPTRCLLSSYTESVLGDDQYWHSTPRYAMSSTSAAYHATGLLRKVRY